MKLNVVVICVDTFRADMGGAGGRLGFVRTPNVDRLRVELNVPDAMANDSAPSMMMSAETLRKVEAMRRLSCTAAAWSGSILARKTTPKAFAGLNWNAAIQAGDL